MPWLQDSLLFSHAQNREKPHIEQDMESIVHLGMLHA